MSEGGVGFVAVVWRRDGCARRIWRLSECCTRVTDRWRNGGWTRRRAGRRQQWATAEGGVAVGPVGCVRMAVSTIPERRWEREDEVGIQLPRSLPSAEEAVSSRLGLDEQRAMFGALHPGDYVVHRDHGVALYKGLQARPAPVQLSSGATVERVQEFLVLQFADGVLYIRADQAEKVTRYYVQGVDDAEDSAKKHSSKPLPRLDALSNTQAWQTTRRRVMRSARRAAVDVLRLQALRASAQRPRYRYDPADPAFMAFDRAFEHRADGGLTPDQRKCIGDIFADLCERDMPMDRLICGDVGVGKTEVAMRAMYLAIRNRRQVAFLAPTTALVAQHYRTLRKRMPGEVCVRALSRFTARREARETLQLIADGVCDIVVGTHALLSSRVQFRALCAALTPGEDATASTSVDSQRRRGLLLVIDEEQRFGVNQKDRIKALQDTSSPGSRPIPVDILTLSATPIPRTLYMALSGIREMSLMHQPPAARLPVHTELLQMDNPAADAQVSAALRRELRRGGQSFFVVPRIADLAAAVEYVQRATQAEEEKDGGGGGGGGDASPSCSTVRPRIAVAHGSSANLERTLYAFGNGEVDVLVCTTIVENGIDIPTAGTMIVSEAHRFGMSQLYQLRGRVGRRAGLQSYCLYLYNPRSARENVVTADRLDALRELVRSAQGVDGQRRRQLPAQSTGFRLAQRDLEIRGAGNIVGVDQSGAMGSVGVELFVSLLREAVQIMQQQQQRQQQSAAENKEPATDQTDHADDASAMAAAFAVPTNECRIQLLYVNAFIPPDLIDDEQLRAQAYRELSAMPDEADLDAWLRQAYSGRRRRRQPMHPSMVHLMGMLKVRLLARRLGVELIAVDYPNVYWDSTASDSAWQQLIGDAVAVYTKSPPPPPPPSSVSTMATAAASPPLPLTVRLLSGASIQRRARSGGVVTRVTLPRLATRSVEGQLSELARIFRGLYRVLQRRYRRS